LQYKVCAVGSGIFNYPYMLCLASVCRELLYAQWFFPMSWSSRSLPSFGVSFSIHFTVWKFTSGSTQFFRSRCKHLKNWEKMEVSKVTLSLKHSTLKQVWKCLYHKIFEIKPCHDITETWYMMKKLVIRKYKACKMQYFKYFLVSLFDTQNNYKTYKTS
jgi:hypothetical protein